MLKLSTLLCWVFVIFIYLFLPSSIHASGPTTIINTSSDTNSTQISSQQHTVMTSDGTLHAFIPVGTQTATCSGASKTGLIWFDSTDSGSTWTCQSQITSSTGFYTSATVDSSDNIYIVYSSAASGGGATHSTFYRKLTKGSGASWTVGSEQTVLSGSATVGYHYSVIEVEGTTRLWLASQYFDGTNYQVVTYYSNDQTAAPTWTQSSSGLDTAGTSASYHRPAIVRFASKIGVIYNHESSGNIRWRYRKDSDGLTAWVSEGTVYASSGSTTFRVSAVGNSSGIVYMAINLSTSVFFTNWNGTSWSSAVTLSSAAASSAFSAITSDGTNIWVYYGETTGLSSSLSGSRKLVYKECKPPFASTDCDSSSTAVVSYHGTFDKYWSYVSSSYTNDTTDAASTTSADTQMVTAIGDIAYFGKTEKFDALSWDVSTSGVTGVITWEYCSAVDGNTACSTWSTLSFTVSSAPNFTADGYGAFTAPSDWVAAKVNSESTAYFYIRARATTGYTTTPIGVQFAAIPLINWASAVKTTSSGTGYLMWIENAASPIRVRQTSGTLETILPSTSSFQPSTPYYSTFLYNWFKNPTTDGSGNWGVWGDTDTGTHSPPTNWHSNYLPQQTLGTFDPSTNLYSSNDYTNFKWQMAKLAEAKQEAVIGSWFGQLDRSDISLAHQITDFVNRSDNPYPNLRYAFYYECEGNTCNATTDPSVTQIVADLNYIAANYASKANYLKINNKPVIFVYADGSDAGTSDASCSDSSMVSRWYQAQAQADTTFYVVLKVFSGYASSQCQPDSWHQYAPSSKTDAQGSYAYAISPGYWKIGEASRLTRSLSSFISAADNMVNASSTWRLTETWNEWGEGTGVEPAVQVVQATGASSAVLDPDGTLFGNLYIDVLNSHLPSLESGTGGSNSAPSAPTSLGSTTVVNGSSTANTTPTFNFTLSDTNSSDTTLYNIQIDDSSDFSSPIINYYSSLQTQGSTSFTVGQAAGSGTYMQGAQNQALSNGNYYWRVKATDNGNLSSSFSTANSGNIAFVINVPLTGVLSAASNYQPPSCGDPAPSSAPDLYAALPQDTNSILLYFTDAGGPIDKYHLEYGTESKKYQFSAQNIAKKGAGSYLVKFLSPNTTYFFRIRGGNVCATGPWSKEISASTKMANAPNQLHITSSKLEAIPIKDEDNSCQIYQVKKGDSLWSIAEQLLGSGSKFQQIIDKNQNQYPSLANSTRLNLGWKLKFNCKNEQDIKKGYNLNIKVENTDQKPIEGASVIIHSKIQDATTDKNGIAKFTNVEPGQHKVLISYKGYNGEESINLSGDVKTFELSIKVQQQNAFLTRNVILVIGVLVLLNLLLIGYIYKMKRTQKTPLFKHRSI